MSRNFYEQELLGAIKNTSIRSIGDASIIFHRLSTMYPTRGSKIDFEKVAASTFRKEENPDLQRHAFANFFEKTMLDFDALDEILYFGDGLTNFVLSGKIIDFMENLDSIFDIPQHHYFTESQLSWCLCLTMEGDMFFCNR